MQLRLSVVIMEEAGQCMRSKCMGSARHGLVYRRCSHYQLLAGDGGFVAEAEREILPKYAVFPSNLNRSEPIPVHSIKSPAGLPKGINEIEAESLENYTYVRCHAPEEILTKVYYDGGEGMVEAKQWRRL